MRINHTPRHKLVKLNTLKYGEIFKYEEEVFMCMNPQLAEKGDHDSVPVFWLEKGAINYLYYATDVIHFPRAELFLNDASF